MRDDRENQRFELGQGDDVVFAQYRRLGDTLYIDHVEAPPHRRGTGAAGELMTAIVALADRESLTLVPICGYAAAWVRRRPQMTKP